MYDTIIVGAGINGLQLGALLAADGKKVLVLEKESRIGGRAAVTRKDGFTLDYGLHLARFGPHGALAETCRRLGREIEFIPLGPSYIRDYDGKLKLFPTRPKEFLTTGLFSFGERLKMAGLAFRLRRGDHGDLDGLSLAAWLNENRIAGGLRRYFHLLGASMLVCPFITRASAGELLRNMQKVLRVGVAVAYPRGGWGPLLDLFAERISDRGEIRTGTAVTRIAVEKNEAAGVYAGEEFIPAGRVVLSPPALELDKLLEGVAAPAFLRQCRAIRPTAGLVLEYGLKEPLSDLSGLVYLYEPMSFGLFTSNIEPAAAPPGKQLLTWLQPLPEEIFRDRDSLAAVERKLEQALGELFPGLEQAREWRRVLPLPVVDGVEVNIGQSAAARPPCRVPGCANLFLVGDSLAAPGAGGDIGYESVHLCYEAIKAGR